MNPTPVIVNDIRRGGWLVLVRETFSSIYELTTPSGDTHDGDIDEAMLLLRMLDMPKLQAERFLDYVHNFQAAKWRVGSDIWERLTLEQAETLGRGQKLTRIG